MDRRQMLWATGSLLLVPRLVAGDEESDRRRRQKTDLKEQLEANLRVTRPEQKEFIQRVVDMVMDKTLPLSLVYAAMRWAIRRRPDYPYPYFERGLTELAKQRGIEITDPEESG